MRACVQCTMEHVPGEKNPTHVVHMHAHMHARVPGWAKIHDVRVRVLIYACKCAIVSEEK